MKFEEFKNLALKPEYPENECVYRVDVVSVKDPLKEIFEKKHFRVEIAQRFLYLDKEAAEMKVTQIGTSNSYNTRIYAMYIYELPINKDVSSDQFQRVWSYDRFGRPVSHSYATEVIDDIEHPSAKYRGRDKEAIRFKPGDIVEVYDRTHEVIVRGIVGKTPLTIEECWKKWEQVRNECVAEGLPPESVSDNYWVSAIDDSYFLIIPQQFTSSITTRSWDVFPVVYPIANSLREEIYTEYAEYISQKDEKGDNGTCSFQELMDML
ncbi:MAG: hypothetical protein K2M69_05135 [Muribaculaceae bacterium]|nr:hypothetical protein [Muribaculaceae bacterium]